MDDSHRRPSLAWALDALMFSLLLFELGIFGFLIGFLGVAFWLYDSSMGAVFVLGGLTCSLVPFIIRWAFKLGVKL
jgi:hypothetical protein